MTPGCPRLVVAGTAGDSGKTLVTLGALLAWRDQGLDPAPFKKGPDYIDAAWLAWAAGRPCHNLDTFLQPPDAITGSMLEHSSARINLVEGNRGLHDGMDIQGTHSTAALARLLQAPVVLVVSAAKVTRTVAAVVLGCQQLDPRVRLMGVVLNRVAGSRHSTLVRQAVEQEAGVEVLGALPRLKQNPLPDRHLGLVTPEEHPGAEGVRQTIRELVADHVNLDRMLEIAKEHSGALTPPARPPAEQPSSAEPISIGYFSDSAFTFYYPDNLTALQRAGARLVPISALDDPRLPAVHALYLGGGFPETHATRLAQNAALMAQVKQAAEGGLPIYAECGGMIYLCRSLTAGGQRHPMAGVLPVDLELSSRPRGHGYVELQVDRDNPFLEPGATLRGHEFHYTQLVRRDPGLDTALRITRGTGCGDGRDGIVHNNVLAGYTHLHALGVPRWAPAMVRAARAHAAAQPSNISGQTN